MRPCLAQGSSFGAGGVCSWARALEASITRAMTAPKRARMAQAATDGPVARANRLDPLLELDSMTAIEWEWERPSQVTSLESSPVSASRAGAAGTRRPYTRREG